MLAEYHELPRLELNDSLLLNQAINQIQNVLFFHPNLLHRSEANLSDNARWSVISAYNLASNKPFLEKNLSCITPISVVPDEAILASGKKAVIGADFLAKEEEITLKINK